MTTFRNKGYCEPILRKLTDLHREERAKSCRAVHLKGFGNTGTSQVLDNVQNDQVFNCPPNDKIKNKIPCSLGEYRKFLRLCNIICNVQQAINTARYFTYAYIF